MVVTINYLDLRIVDIVYLQDAASGYSKLFRVTDGGYSIFLRLRMVVQKIAQTYGWWLPGLWWFSSCLQWQFPFSQKATSCAPAHVQFSATVHMVCLMYLLSNKTCNLMIDCTGLYTVSAILQPYNGRDRKRNMDFLGFKFFKFSFCLFKR